jgi:hypothetical protein
VVVAVAGIVVVCLKVQRYWHVSKWKQSSCSGQVLHDLEEASALPSPSLSTSFELDFLESSPRALSPWLNVHCSLGGYLLLRLRDEHTFQLSTLPKAS